MKLTLEVEGDGDDILVADGAKVITAWRWNDAPIEYRRLLKAVDPARNNFLCTVFLVPLTHRDILYPFILPHLIHGAPLTPTKILWLCDL